MENYDPALENDFDEADRLINDNHIDEGKALLLSILDREPTYGKAHNHLGWIYNTKEDDAVKAEKHYKLALKYAPDYPAPYLNYAYLLSKLARYDELHKHLQLCDTIPGINKAVLAREWGYYYEDIRQFDKAIEKFKQQAIEEYDLSQVEKVEDAIKRCRLKKQILEA